MFNFRSISDRTFCHNGSAFHICFMFKAEVNADIEPREDIDADVEPRDDIDADVEQRDDVDADVEPRDDVDADVETDLKSVKRPTRARRDADGCVKISLKCNKGSDTCKDCRLRKLCNGRISDTRVRKCQDDSNDQTRPQLRTNVKIISHRTVKKCIDIAKSCETMADGCSMCKVRRSCHGRIGDTLEKTCEQQRFKF